MFYMCASGKKIIVYQVSQLLYSRNELENLKWRSMIEPKISLSGELLLKCILIVLIHAYVRLSYPDTFSSPQSILLIILCILKMWGDGLRMAFILS